MSEANVSMSSLPDQIIASGVGALNANRAANELAQQALQAGYFQKSMAEMQAVRDFIGVPEKILGSDLTKHGEIAEQVEVGVRRARDQLVGATPGATFEGVGRTAPADYMIDGLEVQSKFINGAGKSLNHVLEHMEKYENFGRDGSFYHIPKDQHALILRALNGEKIDGLNDASVKSLLEKAKEIEAATGKSFSDVVKPSVSTYSEVQQGKIGETLERHEQDLKKENEALKEQIRVEHEPSLAEGLKAAAGAAAVGAAVGFASAVYKKHQEGKNIFKGEFTAEDWKDVGGDAFKAGMLGGVSGGAIYALTNYAELSAPFAGAFVAAVKGLAPLVSDYRAGKISLDALVDNGLFVCADVAIVGICTAAGQALIPVPVLGAVVGSIAGKVLSSVLAGQTKGLVAAIEARTNVAMQKLDNAYQRVVARITDEFERLGELMTAAFDLSNNEALVQRSLELARVHGVAEENLLHNHSELDAFMLR